MASSIVRINEVNNVVNTVSSKYTTVCSNVYHTVSVLEGIRLKILPVVEVNQKLTITTSYINITLLVSKIETEVITAGI
jgi:hypothetical protein